MRTNDWGPVRQLTEPTCHGCAKYLRGLRVAIVQNESIRDPRFVVDSSALLHNPVSVGAQFGVNVGLHLEAVRSVSGPPAITLGGELHVYAWVDWRRGAWSVVAFGAGP